MLRVPRNMTKSGNDLVPDALQELRRRLPEDWKLGKVRLENRTFDATFELSAPDGTTGRIIFETKRQLDPRGVPALAALVREAAQPWPLVVVSPYLSPSTRESLRGRGVGYLDLTGNAWIVAARPALFIETQGATVDPDRKERPARSLKGPKAGRVVRALIDRKSPPGVREIAATTGVDAGYVSRVIALLYSEALVTRVGHGRIQNVDWRGLLRRWASEAPLESRGESNTYLEARGLPPFLDRLGKSREKYAVTGGLAATRLAPLAPPRLAMVWMKSCVDAAERLGLRPAEAGANVLLVEPIDDLVFEGAREDQGLWYAAPSQVAADLLTSPGRGPAEGEALLEWMKGNEEVWRG
jgi:hypothetical protein